MSVIVAVGDTPEVAPRDKENAQSYRDCIQRASHPAATRSAASP